MSFALKLVIQSLKIKNQNLIGIFKFYLRTFQKPISDRILIVHIKGFNHGRYGFQLINYLHLSGYHIVFYKSGVFLFRLNGYDSLIYNLPGVSFFNKKLINNKSQVDFLCLTTNNNVVSPVSYNTRFELNLDYFGKKSESVVSCIRLPFFIHPLMNQYIPLKKQKKRNRILFYGSNDVGYDSDMMKNRFQLMSRTKVYQIIEESDLDFIFPESYEVLEQQLNNHGIKDAFFFLNSSKVWIPNHKWMSVLASFDFFIATPGVSMPHSHNIIEAMCVGTVPVLQYAEWFSPSLIHMKNAICFRNENEVILRIKELLLAEPREIEELQKNVHEYFSKFIDPINFMARVELLNVKHINLFFNAEELSLQSQESE